MFLYGQLHLSPALEPWNTESTTVASITTTYITKQAAEVNLAVGMLEPHDRESNVEVKPRVRLGHPCHK